MKGGGEGRPKGSLSLEDPFTLKSGEREKEREGAHHARGGPYPDWKKVFSLEVGGRER